MSKLLAASIAVLMLTATAGAASAQSGSSGPSGSGSRGASPSAPPATTTQPRATNPAPGNSQLSNPATGLPGTRPDTATGLPGTRPGGTSTNPSQQLAPGLPPPAATVQPAPQQESVSPLHRRFSLPPHPAAAARGKGRSPCHRRQRDQPECAWRRRQNPGGLHGLLGTGDPHDQEGMERRMPAHDRPAQSLAAHASRTCASLVLTATRPAECPRRRVCG